jgi:hypothetical protein
MICQPAWQLAITMGFSVGFGMATGDLLDENRFGPADVLDRLSWHWFGREADEVTWVSGPDRHADLALRLHASDSRPMSGARIDDDDWRLGWINVSPGGRRDADEEIVDWPGQSAAVAHQFDRKVQHVGNVLRGVLAGIVAALAQRVQKQRGALACVGPILPRRADAG